MGDGRVCTLGRNSDQKMMASLLSLYLGEEENIPGTYRWILGVSLMLVSVQVIIETEKKPSNETEDSWEAKGHGHNGQNVFESIQLVFFSVSHVCACVPTHVE